MTDAASELQLKQVHRVKVTRGADDFGRPVVAHGAIYAGHSEQHLTKFDWNTLEPEWRIAASGFEPWFASGDLLLLTELDTARARGVRSTGEVVWTLDVEGDWGWAPWRDRLFSVDHEGGLLLADAATGRILERIDLQMRDDEAIAGLSDDVLLFQGKGESPYRAYDLVRRQFRWERDLLGEMYNTYRVSRTGPTMIRAAADGRCVAARGPGVCGIDLRDGRLLWHARIYAEALDVDADRVYIWGATDGGPSRVVCLDAATGATVFDVTVRASMPWLVAAISDKHIAYSARSGFIRVFRRTDGALVWSREHQQGLSDAPVITANRLLVPTEGGHLLIFEGDL